MRHNDLQDNRSKLERCKGRLFEFDSSSSSGLFVAKRPYTVDFPTDFLWKLKSTGGKSNMILHLLSFRLQLMAHFFNEDSVCRLILGRQAAVAIVTHWAMYGALISVPWTALSLSLSRSISLSRNVSNPPFPGRGGWGVGVTTIAPFGEVSMSANDVHRAHFRQQPLAPDACSSLGSGGIAWGSPREARNWKGASLVGGEKNGKIPLV